jgi:outer membrane protein OmpA-like peptidoglycan-associated protein
MNFRRGVFVACLVVGPASVIALAQRADVEGGKDHPLISRYPGSVITEYSSKEFDEYTLPLGKLQQDQWAKSQHLEGKLTRIHYEIPVERSPLEVFRNYAPALQRAGFQTLFSCSGGEQCGGGAVGTVGWCAGCSPRHVAAKLARPEGDVYVSLHIEQDNSTTPASVQLDVIETKPMESGLVVMNAENLAGDITRTGHASVYGIYFDTGKADLKPESEATLKEIAKLLQENPRLKLYVVGHTDNVGDLASNMDLSARRAESVLSALTTRHGVAAARLRAVGDGPTAPVASNDSEEGRAKNRRVELVKQ